jgi:hypothetical protein
MVIITNQELIQEYFASPAIGQSTLKKLLGGLPGFHKEVDSSASHFVLGSAVDCILTAEEGEFEKQYYVSNVEKKPSDAIVAILSVVHARLLEDYQEYLSVTEPVMKNTIDTSGWENLEPNEVLKLVTGEDEISSFSDYVCTLSNWETYLLDAASEMDWQRTWGDAAKIKNLVNEKNEEYFLDLCQAYGKSILDSRQNETVWNIVRSLQNNPRTARFFNRAGISENPLVEVYYQFPIYFEHKGIACKGLLDMVVVEKSIDTVIEGVETDPYITSIVPIDFKTMFDDTYNFMGSLKLRRYDIQAAWYTLGLHKCFNISEDSNIVKPFIFVVESTTFQGKPLAYELTDEVLNIGRYGRAAVKIVESAFTYSTQPTQFTIQRKVLGFEDLLDEYIFYETNGWHEERLIQASGTNPILLSWDGIVDMS